MDLLWFKKRERDVLQSSSIASVRSFPLALLCYVVLVNDICCIILSFICPLIFPQVVVVAM